MLPHCKPFPRPFDEDRVSNVFDLVRHGSALFVISSSDTSSIDRSHLGAPAFQNHLLGHRGSSRSPPPPSLSATSWPTTSAPLLPYHGPTAPLVPLVCHVVTSLNHLHLHPRSPRHGAPIPPHFLHSPRHSASRSLPNTTYLVH